MAAALALPDTIEGLGRMGMESTSSKPAAPMGVKQSGKATFA